MSSLGAEGQICCKDAADDSETELDIADCNLFLNTQYQEQEFLHGKFKVSLLVSESACTDFDLTGQVIWPAARILSDYLAKHPEAAHNASACELGAGAGLVGCVAAQLCNVLLTDGNETVVKLLEENAALNRSCYDVQACRLEWACEEDITAVRSRSPKAAGFNLLLAADVCYGQGSLPSLFTCAAALLQRSVQSRMLLGYVSRAANIDRRISEEAVKVGFVISEIEGTRQSVGGGHKGVVYMIRWPGQ